MNLDLMLSAMDDIHEIFDRLDNIQMICSVIGTSFDEWCAEHGMSSRETCEALRILVEVQEQVHLSMGSADYVNR